ncbi:MAG: hypothetical protein AAFX46_23025, partial [Cyanobacteria bacterium J06636_27]
IIVPAVNKIPRNRFLKLISLPLSCTKIPSNIKEGSNITAGTMIVLKARTGNSEQSSVNS